MHNDAQSNSARPNVEPHPHQVSRSEEHTSELQSPCNLVYRLLLDRKSTRLNSSHLVISYAVFCLKKKDIDLATATASATMQRNSNILRTSVRGGDDRPWAQALIPRASDATPVRFFFFLMIRRPPRSTLFPSRTLFRSLCASDPARASRPDTPRKSRSH